MAAMPRVTIANVDAHPSGYVELDRAFDICRGPDKWAWILDLFENNVGDPRYAVFTLDLPGQPRVTVSIQAHRRNSAAGSEWKFEGLLVQDHLIPGERQHLRVYGEFNLRTREGRLTVTREETLI